MATARKPGDTPPLRSPWLDAERARIAAATEAFLANGGAIRRSGTEHPADTPSSALAHLHLPPEPPAQGGAPTEALPGTDRQAEQVKPSVSVKCRRTGLTSVHLAARLMVQAALGASPKAAATAIGITEKHARQLARDHHITFKRQR